MIAAVAFLYLAMVVAVCSAAVLAPYGWEDDEGFHLGHGPQDFAGTSRLDNPTAGGALGSPEGAGAVSSAAPAFAFKINTPFHAFGDSRD